MTEGAASGFFLGVTALVAIAALVQARRASREVARLTEMYWQLKYEHSELKAALQPPAPPPPAPSAAFVPLSSVKRGTG